MLLAGMFRVHHPHVSMLLLALDLGYLILLLLELLGNDQVLLHQAVLVDVGGQVALNCRDQQKHRLLKTRRSELEDFSQMKINTGEFNYRSRSCR